VQYTLDTSKALDLSWGGTGVDRILRNIVNLLRIRRYDIPYMRCCGIDQDIHNLPTKQIESVLSNQVMDLIQVYEPRGKVISVKLLNINQNGQISAEVVIEI